MPPACQADLVSDKQWTNLPSMTPRMPLLLNLQLWDKLWGEGYFSSIRREEPLGQAQVSAEDFFTCPEPAALQALHDSCHSSLACLRAGWWMTPSKKTCQTSMHSQSKWLIHHSKLLRLHNDLKKMSLGTKPCIAALPAFWLCLLLQLAFLQLF